MFLKSNLKGTFLGLAIVFCMAMAPALQAQEYASEGTQGHGGDWGQTGGQTGGQQEYNRDTLETFVDASQKVRGIAQQYQGRLANAENSEEMRQIQQEASQQMTRAVQESDIDVQTYNDISQKMRQDPALNERISEIQGN